MDHQIALSPDLDISPTDFAAAWKASEHARTLAAVSLAPSTNKSYLDSATMEVIITAASTIGLGVLTNAIYDVLKAALIKKGKPHTHITITDFTLPDGTRLFNAEIDEEG